MDQQISIHCLTRTTPDGPSAQYTTQPGELCRSAFTQASVKASDLILACLSFTCTDLCWECRESFLFQQQRDLREYTQATVYVRKVLEDKRVWTWAVTDLRQVFFCKTDSGFLCWGQTVKEAAPELTASSSEAEEEKEEHVKVEGEGDPDFGQVHTHASEPLCLPCFSAVKPYIFLITIPISIYYLLSAFFAHTIINSVQKAI